MSSGGSAVWRSRGRRDAMPKPVRRTSPFVRVDEDVAGFDVLVNETAVMHARDSVGDGDGQSQERSDRQAWADHLGRAAWLRGLEHQHRLAAFAHQLERPECPLRIEVVPSDRTRAPDG